MKLYKILILHNITRDELIYMTLFLLEPQSISENNSVYPPITENNNVYNTKNVLMLPVSLGC